MCTTEQWTNKYGQHMKKKKSIQIKVQKEWSNEHVTLMSVRSFPRWFEIRWHATDLYFERMEEWKILTPCLSYIIRKVLSNCSAKKREYGWNYWFWHCQLWTAVQQYGECIVELACSTNPKWSGIVFLHILSIYL